MLRDPHQPAFDGSDRSNTGGGVGRVSPRTTIRWPLARRPELTRRPSPADHLLMVLTDAPKAAEH
jgi:hypothetical protein